MNARLQKTYRRWHKREMLIDKDRKSKATQMGNLSWRTRNQWPGFQVTQLGNRKVIRMGTIFLLENKGWGRVCFLCQWWVLQVTPMGNGGFFLVGSAEKRTIVISRFMVVLLRDTLLNRKTKRCVKRVYFEACAKQVIGFSTLIFHCIWDLRVFPVATKKIHLRLILN